MPLWSFQGARRRLMSGQAEKPRQARSLKTQQCSYSRGRRTSRRARIRTYSSRASAHRSNCSGIP
jgi:hypothetical protein